MRALDLYRTAYRAFALARKTVAYACTHGLAQTARRVAQGVAARSDAAREVRPAKGDGLAPLVISTMYNGAVALAPLTRGARLSQEISVPVERIYEVELRFAPDGPGPRGYVSVTGSDGVQLYRERLDPLRRGADGRYLLRLNDELSMPAQADRFRIVIHAHGRGRRGASPLIDPGSSLGALEVAHGGARTAERIDGALALRIMARSSRAAMRYHRAPVPPDFADATRAGTMFVVGEGPLRPQVGATEPVAVRPIDARGFLACRPTAGCDALVLADIPDLETLRGLVKFAQSRYVPVVCAVARPVSTSPEDKSAAAWRQLVEWSDAVLLRDGEDAPGADGRPAALCWGPGAPHSMLEAVAGWLPEYRRRVLPRVSIVTVLYGKARQIESVLQTYFRQSYRGELEIVFVDDCSPDDAVPRIEQAFARACADRPTDRVPVYKVVRNERNMGNCVSRNVGIAQASGDLIVVIDADCMLCRDFVARHAEAHSYVDCDVVIGPQNIETEGREPLEYLAELERRPQLVSTQAEPQDAINPLSFLNCVTRNFSIRRAFIREPLFDPQFSYSADPASGFGWEDVEMGCRLYRRGARIKHVGDAFSVHITHPSSVPEADKPVRSLRNFRRLLEKHPDLALEARRWVAATYDGIKSWSVRHGHTTNDDMCQVERLLAAKPAGGAVAVKAPRRRLRILTYRWHVPHQYELYKLPHDFTLLDDLDSPMTHQWEFRHRPLPDNVRFRSRRGLRLADYDAAILHFDENVLSHENTNGVLGPDWGAAFRWSVKNVDLPRVAICHGTPQFHGQYNFDYGGPDLMQVIEPAHEKLVEYVGDMLVVCNSHQAQREWRFRKSRVVWHGFDPTEFPPATYERGILSPLGPLVMSRPHYRGYFLYRKVFDGFPERFAPSTLFVPDPSPLYEGNQYAIWKYRNYVDEIRRYSVYFNPTLRSPMPRARRAHDVRGGDRQRAEPRCRHVHPQRRERVLRGRRGRAAGASAISLPQPGRGAAHRGRGPAHRGRRVQPRPLPGRVAGDSQVRGLSGAQW